MKNIVICCDGTDNKLTVSENTNVLHFYSCLEKNEDQILYYNPGVGTIYTKSSLKAFKSILKKYDKAKAVSLTHNVIDAYKFLISNYVKGDKVFLIGFSRGAYTVRMLCGLLQMYGLLMKGNENHLNYLLEIYYLNEKEKWHIANKFKKRFSRDIDIEYLGIWDTVVSVGGIFRSYQSFPYSSSLENVNFIRHALAIDERRKHFKPTLVSKKHRDLKEVWFSGVHSDIGGGYKEEGLSKIALEWILYEAIEKGICIDSKNVNKYLYGQGDVQYGAPNYLENIHDSFKANRNWVLDLIPRKRARLIKNEDNDKVLEYYYDFDYGLLRKIESDSTLHASVLLKIEKDKDYNPINLQLDKLEDYPVEKWNKIKLKIK